MNERYIGAREANQQFSALLNAVERDRETVVITRRGKAVARLIPEVADESDRADGNWIIDLVARLERPMRHSTIARDELHDRGDR